ncbi:DNA protecting protein DprA [Candidatus Roizmanbacteria bacterium RIFCSPHIGHO2_02_FULL_37_15]|nr:MAG: DNA protecting protein DprA [Candidatus Roizmanbacteria bacterium RIFCSPHIGHO2_01_FULL_37_16b]OGK21671.1 MAG: DNA protecting protein DprA [Candidatus Roizmanbacteria bacterium RIFCSPHIGHO2_02_FULL_37_15]
MDKNLPYYLGFSHFLGIGPTRFAALISYFGNVKKAYEAKEKDLKEVIGAKWAEKFAEFRAGFDPIKKLDELRQKEILTIACDEKNYPSKLLNIPDPPICLYVKGNLNTIDFENGYLIAVVGTRKPTPYGIQIARKFSSELAQSGFIIVSGMAIGIDTTAHWAAIDNGGKTVIVLGCGVDIVYPAINRRLYEKVINDAGVIISEFPPGQLVEKGLFVARNRLISGLSMGVVVIEGAEDSGALITAKYAANQGKEVFAPPAPLTSKMSAAPNLLLKQGAKLVTSVDDILEEFNLRIVPKKKAEMEKELEGEEKIIFEFLQSEPKLSDEIVNLAKLSIDQVLNVLSILEIKGIVEKNSEGKYQIKLS